MTDRKKITYLVARFVPEGSDEATQQKWLKRVQKAAYDLQCYYRNYNRKNWDFSAYACVILADVKVGPPSYARNYFDEWVAENPVYDENGEQVKFTHFAAWGPISEEYCGLGTLSGNRCCVNTKYTTCSTGTLIHEVGHNMGFMHSGYLDETSQYGNRADIMGGGGDTLKGLNSFHMCQKDFDTMQERFIVNDENAQLLLTPIERSRYGMFPNMYQNLVLKRSGFDDIYVSLRKVRGNHIPPSDNPPRINPENKLYADVVLKGERYLTRRIKGDWKPSEDLWVLPNGMALAYHEYEDEIASISVLKSPDEPVPVPLPIPKGFVPSLPSSTVGKEHQGVWYDPWYNNQGFDIYINMDFKVNEETVPWIVGYWYTYEWEDDTRNYYFWTCPIQDAMKEFIVYKTKKGTWEDPTTYEEEAVGTGKIEFFDEMTGLIQLNMKEFGHLEIELTRLSPRSDHPMNGIWYNPDERGSGFTFQFFPNPVPNEPPMSSAYMYAFDTLGNKMWIMAVGKQRHDGVYDYVMQEVQGGVMLDFSQFTANDVGEMTARLDPYYKTIKVTYTLHAEAAAGSKSMDLIPAF
jgi:hypothetical protein